MRLKDLWARQSYFALVVLLAWLHLFVHGTNIDLYELSLDEAGTWGVATHSLARNLTLPTEFHSQPPLYYLVLHVLVGIDDSVWFLRGFSWLCCLAFIFYVLLYLEELNVAARVALCLVFIHRDLTKYLATAVRPYGLAAFLTLVSLVYFMRMVKNPTPRRAVTYVVVTLLMAYTMAFEVAVLLVQGLFLALVCLVELPVKGPRGLWRTRRELVTALAVIAIGYLPYLAMAIHYQYRANPTDTSAAVLSLATYSNTFVEHFGFPLLALVGMGGFCLLGVAERLRERRFETLVLPLLCVGQIAFVWYFIVGRSVIGPLGKYMMPAFVAACLMVGFGVNALVQRTSKVTGLAFAFTLCFYLWPQYKAFAAYMHAPIPDGEFQRLAKTMRLQPGNRLLFVDVGYEGQPVEYVLRDDPSTQTATMRGSGWASGGDSHLTAEYIIGTVEATKGRTRCYYYYLTDAAGVFATAFVPTMTKLGYLRIPDMPAVLGHPVPGFCRS